MGYLTTLTIYNDGLDLLTKHAEQFASGVRTASLEAPAQQRPRDIAVGNHANLVKVQIARHADDHTVYVHMGNTVCEMLAYSPATENLMREHPKFFAEMLMFMQRQVKELSAQFARIQENQNAGARQCS